jgi:peroxiredoxin
MDKSFFGILVIFLVAVVLPGPSCTNVPKPEIPVIVSCDGMAEIGKPAPNFTWVGKDNIKHSLTDYRGKAVIITTWTASCAICVDVQLPYLAESYKKLTDQGVYILAINNGDSEKHIVQFLSSKNYPFTILSDKPNPEYKFRSPYRLKQGDPYFVFIDKNGILVDILVAGSETDLNNAIENFVDSQTKGIPYTKWVPLQISDATIIKANSSFTVRWKTNKESTSIVILTDSKRGLCMSSDRKTESVLNHEVRMNYSDLQPDTDYSVAVSSTDRYTNNVTKDAGTVSFTATATSCGSVAPDFALISQEGKFVRLSDFKGKKVLLHFWSYTCHVCAEELPLFKSFYSGLSRNKLELITISVGGDITTVNNYITEQGYKFPVLFDSDGAADTKYKNAGVPTSYLISGDGCILEKRDGKFDSLYDLREFTGTLY